MRAKIEQAVYNHQFIIALTMNSLRCLCFLLLSPLLASFLRAAVVEATWNSASDVPVTAASYTATGNTVNFTLNHAPATGANLTVVKNTGLPFISGTFGNLAQGQEVTLVYAGINYFFIANYYGGNGNDLILQWADNRVGAWGFNGNGQLGDNSTTNRSVPVVVTSSGVLSGKTVVSIAAGGYHTFALCSDGTLAAWGSNSQGQLGDNSTTSRSVPVAITSSGVLSGKTVVSIAAGDYHSLALCSDGTLAAWGYNAQGRLGDNSTTNRSVPVVVTSSGVLSGKTVVSIVAGGDQTFALCSDSTLAAWGVNNLGQLGNNSTTNSSVPVAITSSGVLSGKTVSAICSGDFAHSLAIFAFTRFPEVSTANATSIIGNEATLNGLVNALSTNTTVYFEYGLTTAYGSTVAGTPSLVTGSTDTSVSANIAGFIAGETYHYRVVATNAYGTSYGIDRTFVISTNANLAGLLTNRGAISPGFSSGTTSYTLTVPDGVTNISIQPTVWDAGSSVKVNGTTVSSGSYSGVIELALGPNVINIEVTAQDGITKKTYSLTVTRPSFNSASDVQYTGNGYAASGNISLWPLSFSPPAGTNLTVVKNTGLDPISGTFTNLTQGQLVVLSYGGVNYQFVANYYGGDGNDLVLQWANTRPLAWGTNGSGQLGNGSVLDRAVPFPTDRTGVLAGKTIFTLATGANHSLALCSDGTVASWGNNSYGQLGNNSTTDSPVSVSVIATGVLSGKKVIAIAAGQYHNLALCSDGTLAAWGYNFYGQLGNGLTDQSNIPVAVNKSGVLSGKTIIAIAAGTYHSFALCSDGTLASWGYNGNGELGNGGTGYSPLPVTVDRSGVLSGKTIRSVIAGSFHNFALCTDGTLAGWGYNAYGQLGNNSTNSSTVPVLVSASGVLTGKTIIAASAGYYHTLALCSDGTLTAWGSNSYGELGNGNNTSSQVPVAVTISGVLAGKSVTGLSTGAVHNVSLCSDGTIAAWGYNGDGELGNNSSVSSNVPVLVSSAPLAPGERFVAGRSGPTSLHTLSLVASPPLPVVTTLAASGITSTSAVLNGAINANGTSTTPIFEYGLTTAYGSSVAGSPSSVTGTASTAVSAAITGLAPGTTYHCRLSGTGAAGTVTSADGIFTTTGYNANLSGLTLSTGTLDPVFSTDTIGYTASVPSTTTTISVTPTVATPSSTVKVNGASVVSGSASTPIFLLPGNNTITVVVTAQDLVTTKTYTISVTRLAPAPEIGVTQAGSAIADGGSKDLGPATGMRPAVITFVIKNTGNSDLTGLGITIDGPDAAQFSLTSPPTAPVAGPSGSTTFTVAFTPAGAGTRSAALHISNNDADENPYDIALTGTGLSSTVDTDGDGLNDAAEFQMEALGFDWQVSQPALVNVYFANAETGGLGSGQGLYVDAPKLTKDPGTGLFKLQIGIQKSTDLLNFTPFPMTAPQTTINGNGKLEFEFASPDNAAFYRLLAE